MTNIKLYARDGAIVSRVDKDIRDLIDSIDVKAGQIIVDYGCSNSGHIGIILAGNFPSSTVHLVADNLKDTKAVRRNIKENNLNNVFIHIDDSLSFLDTSNVDLIIMKPSGYEGKEVLRARITDSWSHIALGGQLYLSAHMRHGAPSLMKLADEVFGGHEVLKKGGGTRIIRATRTTFQADQNDRMANLIEAQILDKPYRFQTASALFSRDQVDKGSLLLLESVDIAGSRAILDLGCGYGVIGIVTADRHRDKQVTLVDIEIQAVKTTMANISLNGVEGNTRVMLSDGFEELQGSKFDLILSHFPLHIPKAEQERLLRAAKNALTPGGRFCLVALSAYDLRALLQSIFNNISTAADTSERATPGERYRVLCATKM
jgi:16S rRNA (guanine1207-N2)-methyltransferase